MKPWFSIFYICMMLILTSCIGDQERPVVYIQGEENITIFNNEAYKDEGATAYDQQDGDLTNQIRTTNNHQFFQIGTYYYNYSVSDFSGNEAEATRTVNVISYQYRYVGRYTSSGCFFVNEEVDIIPGDIESEIIARPFLDNNLPNNELILSYSGPSLTITPQQMGVDNKMSISGTGSFDEETGTVILDITYNDGIETKTCQTTLTRVGIMP